MKHTEFRESLLSSLVETIEDSRRKRNETSNPLTYAVYNGQVELLTNMLQWAGSLIIEECCHVDADHAPPESEPETESEGRVTLDSFITSCAYCGGTSHVLCICDPVCPAPVDAEPPEKGNET